MEKPQVKTKKLREAQSAQILTNVPPQMARRSIHTMPLPANYMLRLTSHFLFPTNANFIEKMNMLYMEQYISILHSFQFVSTAQYNGPSVYVLAI